MNTPDDDKDLHDDTISRLYRALPDETPPAALDAAIQAAAHRAVANRAGERRILTWLATAASLVLMTGLFMHWQQRAEEVRAVVAPLPATPRAPSSDTDAAGMSESVLHTDTRQPTTPTTAQRLPPSAKTRAVAATAATHNAPEHVTTADTPSAAADTPSYPVADAAQAAPSLSTTGHESAASNSASPPPAPAMAPAPGFVARALAPEPMLKKSAPSEATLLAEKVAPRSTAIAAPTALPTRHRAMMAAGDWSGALQMLIAASASAFPEISASDTWPTPSPLVDRDILGAITGSSNPPGCQSQLAKLAPRDAAWCRTLIRYQEKSITEDQWRALEQAGAISGDMTYRARAAKILFAPEKPVRK